MKILSTFSIAAFFFTAGFTQSDVPAALKTKFATMYPDARATKWEVVDGLYEASFLKNNIETEVLLSLDGSVLQTETEIGLKELPQPVRGHVATELGAKKITEASRISGPNGAVNFEIEVDNIDYLFDSEGNFIGIEIDGAEEDDVNDDRN